MFVEIGTQMRRRVLLSGVLSLVVVGGAILWLGLAHRRDSELSARALIRTQGERLRTSILGKIGPELLGENFKNAKMRGVTLRRSGNAFQRADFSSAVLDQSTLEAGASSFQLACFDKASIRNAQLSGGAASFQLASFENADLCGASLNGNFQLASFQNAVLRESKLLGSFHGCNISGATFAGADLSGIDRHSLESCYFSAPPVFSSKTNFPRGFEPATHGWQESLQ